MLSVFVLKKEPSKNMPKMFHFLKNCYFVLGGNIDMDELSGKCSFVTFPKINPRLWQFECQK